MKKKIANIVWWVILVGLVAGISSLITYGLCTHPKEARELLTGLSFIVVAIVILLTFIWSMGEKE